MELGLLAADNGGLTVAKHARSLNTAMYEKSRNIRVPATIKRFKRNVFRFETETWAKRGAGSEL